jgi:hypothetical protein
MDASSRGSDNPRIIRAEGQLISTEPLDGAPISNLADAFTACHQEPRKLLICLNFGRAG